MKSELFCNEIKLLLKNYQKSEIRMANAFQLLTESLDKTNKTQDISEQLKILRMTILFEGFYQYLPKDTPIKEAFLLLRIKKWSKHFGTPTVPFLLTYKEQINKTCEKFIRTSRQYSTPAKDSEVDPWNVNINQKLVVDQENNVLVDKDSITLVSKPEKREITGTLTKTHNPYGGFTTTPCDPISQKFIEYSSDLAKQGGKVLEIGAAFGAATLEALSRGTTVYCNDIDPKNLAVVRNRFSEESQLSDKTATGDISKLVLIPGEFPQELSGLPSNTFDAILICRVLHFFPGRKIEAALKQMSKLLVDSGRIYIVCETPYLKNWQRFIPEFNQRTARGEYWPGEITNPADFESSGRAASLPTFVHWITKEVLERTLTTTKFSISHIGYISRKGQFPDDLVFPDAHEHQGKESIGAVAIKSKL